MKLTRKQSIDGKEEDGREKKRAFPNAALNAQSFLAAIHLDGSDRPGPAQVEQAHTICNKKKRN